jgi:hypothetical protein
MWFVRPIATRDTRAHRRLRVPRASPFVLLLGCGRFRLPLAIVLAVYVYRSSAWGPCRILGMR